MGQQRRGSAYPLCWGTLIIQSSRPLVRAPWSGDPAPAVVLHAQPGRRTLTSTHNYWTQLIPCSALELGQLPYSLRKSLEHCFTSPLWTASLIIISVSRPVYCPLRASCSWPKLHLFCQAVWHSAQDWSAMCAMENTFISAGMEGVGGCWRDPNEIWLPRKCLDVSHINTKSVSQMSKWQLLPLCQSDPFLDHRGLPSEQTCFSESAVRWARVEVGRTVPWEKAEGSGASGQERSRLHVGTETAVRRRRGEEMIQCQG